MAADAPPRTDPQRSDTDSPRDAQLEMSPQAHTVRIPTPPQPQRQRTPAQPPPQRQHTPAQPLPQRQRSASEPQPQQPTPSQSQPQAQPPPSDLQPQATTSEPQPQPLPLPLPSTTHSQPPLEHQHTPPEALAHLHPHRSRFSHLHEGHTWGGRTAHQQEHSSHQPHKEHSDNATELEQHDHSDTDDSTRRSHMSALNRITHWQYPHPFHLHLRHQHQHQHPHQPGLRLRHHRVKHFHQSLDRDARVKGLWTGTTHRMHSLSHPLALREHFAALVIREAQEDMASLRVPADLAVRIPGSPERRLRRLLWQAKPEVAQPPEPSPRAKRAAHNVRRQDIGVMMLVVAGGLTSIVAFAFYTPTEQRRNVHTAHMHAFSARVTSPLFATSASEPLLFGGSDVGILPVGHKRSCIDLKMIDSCLALDDDCEERKERRNRARRSLMAVHPPSRVKASRGLSAETEESEASLRYEFIAGDPSSSSSRVFHSVDVELDPYHDVEVYDECVSPEDQGVPDDQLIYLRITTNVTESFGLMLQVVELDAIAKYRVLLSGLLFLFVFGLILSEIINRVYAALWGAMLALGLQMIILEKPELHTVMDHVDWGTIVLLFSMMINVHVLSLTGFFQWTSVRMAGCAKGNPVTLFVALAALTGVLSAFLDNVTCVMLMGPVTVSLCRQMGVPSLPFFLTQTLTATIGGAGTMVGDPPNVVIGNQLELPFTDFIIYNGPLVFLLLLPISILVQLWRFRKQVPKHVELDLARLKKQNPIVDMRTFCFTGVVFLLLFLAFFLTPVHGNEPAVYTLLGMLTITLCVSRHHVRHLLEAVEWDTLIFFVALFIFVGTIAELGLIRFIGDTLTDIIESVPIDSRAAVAQLLFLWISALGSAFLESLPYTTTIVAILQRLDEDTLGIPTWPLAWALSIGACIGGIGSIMGSSANLVAVAVSVRYADGKSEEEIHGRHFLMYGLPLLLLLTCVASLYQYVLFIHII